MLKVGDRVTDFRLEGTFKGENKSFSLSDFAGQNVALVFFPFAFTPV
jgi:peroxiredoxin